MKTTTKQVLDVACGSKMFYFDKNDSRVLFQDKRREKHITPDSSTKQIREVIIDPDFIGDFTKLEFEDESFSLVVFDPPHLIKAGKKSFLAKKYGVLDIEWKQHLMLGFKECFRVLKNNGVLIFKWNETQIKVSEILKLTDEKPLFGNRCGKQMKSHWLCFLKGKYELT